LQLIRNATLKLYYAGSTILIDPCLAPKHGLESFAGKSLNPTVDLPASIDEIVHDVELVVVSHLHSDHYDDVAKESLSKHLPLICQPGDEETIGQDGFADVRPLARTLEWRGIRFSRRKGSHGLGPVVEEMGPVMGIVIEAAGEPTIYWAGDTVFYPPVAATIDELRPDVTIVHSCGALWNGDLIVMDGVQTVDLCHLAPTSGIVIATHMEALDHATVDRLALRREAAAAGISEKRLLIPIDGETLDLPMSSFSKAA